MTLTEARKILGLGPDEDPRPHLIEFKKARERIAAIVRTAPNETLAIRYQQGLVEFDQALAAVREYLEALGLAPPPVPPPVIAEAAPQPTQRIGPTVEEAGKPSRALSVFAWLFVLLVAIGGVAWLYFEMEKAETAQRQTRVIFLERQGTVFLENRRWPEAAAAFSEIERLMPGSQTALLGRRGIEAGKLEEQTQFLAYWTGEARAALEAGRLEDAETAARKVSEKFPAEREVADILDRVRSARTAQSRIASIAAARALLEKNEWEAAISATREILTISPGDADAKSLLAEATAARDKAAANLAKARELFNQAVVRDQGQFDQQALDWLREAASLAPGDAEITSRFEKMAAYTRTLRVPGDFATPAEALAAARERDRIVLAAGSWKGPLAINVPGVELQGSGAAETLVECPPGDGSALTIGPAGTGVRVSGIGFRHESFAVGSERFSAALVRGGSVTFSDCRFSDASGHGLALIEGGRAIASRCRFSGNGWNGAAASGPGATLDVRDSESQENFEHGIEAWDGAALSATNTRCVANSRNGIHADCGKSAANLTGNQLLENREFGLVLGSAGSGKISGNTARGNLLGGFVIRAAAPLPFTTNQAAANLGPGLTLEKGLSAAAYSENTLTGNSGGQILPDTDLSAKEETPGP